MMIKSPQRAISLSVPQYPSMLFFQAFLPSLYLSILNSARVFCWVGPPLANNGTTFISQSVGLNRPRLGQRMSPSSLRMALWRIDRQAERHRFPCLVASTRLQSRPVLFKRQGVHFGYRNVTRELWLGRQTPTIIAYQRGGNDV